MTDYKIQKPFLKWVGGKTQIIDSIISKLPKELLTRNHLEKSTCFQESCSISKGR